jgi:hypothetical protein
VGVVSVRGFQTRYTCVEASFSYVSEYINTLEELFTRGLMEEEDKTEKLAQWRQRFAMIAAFSSLEAALRGEIKYYAYEVDLPLASQIEIVDRAGVGGLVGYLRQNNRLLYELPRVAVHLPGERKLGSPDGIALFAEGGVKGIYLLEVGSEFDYALNKFFGQEDGLFKRLSDAGVVSACRGGVCLTPYGVALVGLRTDAVGGATVGAMAAGAVAEEVVAYPQIKSSLLEWAELLNREAVVRLVVGDYQEVQRGAYRLRLLALEKALLSDDTREAAARAWATCWG